MLFSLICRLLSNSNVKFKRFLQAFIATVLANFHLLFPIWLIAKNYFIGRKYSTNTKRKHHANI
jgi:hypothetical protein